MPMEPGQNMDQVEDNTSRHAFKVLVDRGLPSYIAEIRAVKVERGSGKLLSNMGARCENGKCYCTRYSKAQMANVISHL